jgi:hypothetical protein
MEQPQSAYDAAFGLPALARLVISQKVKMGDADWDHEVNRDVVEVSVEDCVGEGRWAADRIGDDKQSVRLVARHRWHKRRNAQAWHSEYGCQPER